MSESESLERRVFLVSSGIGVVAAAIAAPATAQPNLREPHLNAIFLTQDRRLARRTVDEVNAMQLAEVKGDFAQVKSRGEALRGGADQLAGTLVSLFFGDLALFERRPADALREWGSAARSAEANRQDRARLFAVCRQVWMRRGLAGFSDTEQFASVKPQTLDTPQALKLLDEVVAEATKLKDEFSEAFGYHMRGTVHQLEGDQKRALQEFEKALKIRVRIGHASANMTRIAMGNSYALMGEADKALAMIGKERETAAQKGFTHGEQRAVAMLQFASAAKMVNVLEDFDRLSKKIPSDEPTAGRLRKEFQSHFTYTRPSLDASFRNFGGNFMD